VYFVLFGSGFFYMLRLIAKGPQAHEGSLPTPGGPGEKRQQMRPLSAAHTDDSHPSPVTPVSEH
jgi:cytochrome d ubiquinol oxidase subunit I